MFYFFIRTNSRIQVSELYQTRNKFTFTISPIQLIAKLRREIILTSTRERTSTSAGSFKLLSLAEMCIFENVILWPLQDYLN